MPNDKTLVLVEDITFTDRLETEARKLGGGLTGKMTEEQAAMFSFPAGRALQSTPSTAEAFKGQPR